MTAKLYLAHSEMRSINAKILAIVVAADGRPAVRLNQTIFHAQGGGQKADVGRIGDARVLHVTHNGGNVDHVVDSPELLTVGSIVRAELDHSWRSLNAAHHTAGHLVASVVERIFPSAKAVSGHQWPGEGRVEFEGPVPVEGKAEIEAALLQAITDALPVKMLGDPYGERSIRIGDMTAIPCGGTHVENLSAIASIQIRSINFKKGKVRISYDAIVACR